MQAARRRAPRSAAPRFPAAARALRAPAPTLELRTGRTRPGSGPQKHETRPGSRSRGLATWTLPGLRGPRHAAFRGPRSASQRSNQPGPRLWPPRCPVPRPPSTFTRILPPPFPLLRHHPFIASVSPSRLGSYPPPQKPSRPDPATLLGFSVHSWKFRAWIVAPSPP